MSDFLLFLSVEAVFMIVFNHRIEQNVEFISGGVGALELLLKFRNVYPWPGCIKQKVAMLTGRVLVGDLLRPAMHALSGPEDRILNFCRRVTAPTVIGRDSFTRNQAHRANNTAGVNHRSFQDHAILPKPDMVANVDAF